MIGIIIGILLFLSLVANGVMIYICWKFARRLFQFDDLFVMLTDDIDVNARYLEKLTNTPLLENSPEIVTAHNNMKIVGQRLDEFIVRMEEITGRELRKKDGLEVGKNPPVIS